MKGPQLWRIFTIFRIKSQRLNQKLQLLQIDEILQMQEVSSFLTYLSLLQRIDSELLEVAEESEVDDMLALDIGCFWEFSSNTAREAIQLALPSIQKMWQFIAYWDTSSVPDFYLDNCIRSSRLNDSKFVTLSLQKLGGGKNLTEKIRLLRRYGKYLNNSEYSSFASTIKYLHSVKDIRCLETNLTMKLQERKMLVQHNF
jgi:hypothetical protein